jgi:site-specific DNA-cytosine methylase
MKKFSAIGINIYGGGFTIGALKHFNVLGQWEQINLGKKTFDENFTGIHRPLKIEEWPVKEYAGKIDFVYANPPCVPWSSASTSKGYTKEKRFEHKLLDLTASTMKTALKLKPKVFISESVENAYNFGKVHYDKYAVMWRKQDYQVTYFLTDAILHGSPCARRRFHFVASKFDLITGKCPDIRTPKTIRDTIGDINNKFGILQGHEERPEKVKHMHKLMIKTKPGKKLVDSMDADPTYTGPRRSFLVKKLDWDSPGFTMVGFDFIHPDGRWLTKREAARLCTYPDSFKVLNAIETVDSVIPCVADFLCNMAKNTIIKKKPIKEKMQIVDWRKAAIQFHPRNYIKK